MGRWRLRVFGILSAAVFGCASPYRSLVAEDSLPDLREAKQATLTRENHTVLAPTYGSRGPDIKVAVHEFQAAQTDRVVVFVHGVFADHETWRFVAGDLARDHAVWLIDMPGCGDSDAPRVIREETYTIGDTAERSLQALRHCLIGKPPAKIALVGHSYGSAVIVRMFSDPGLRARYTDVLANMDRLVLISPLDVALSRPAPLYKQIAEASTLRVRMGLSFGEIKKRVAAATINSVPDPSRALREEADKKLDILANGDRRAALQTMIARAVPWTPALRPDWDKIEVMEASYADVDRECLIVVGMRDEALPSSMAYKMALQLPRTSFVPLKGVMHSPHIEAHEKCATLIREFVTTGRVTVDLIGPHGEP